MAADIRLHHLTEVNGTYVVRAGRRVSAEGWHGESSARIGGYLQKAGVVSAVFAGRIM